MLRFIVPLVVAAGPLWADVVKEYRALHGLYGPNETCLGEELIVEIGDQFGIGETVCRRVLLEEDGDWIELILTECFSEGEPSDDRRYGIRGAEAGSLILRRPEQGDMTLAQCEDL